MQARHCAMHSHSASPRSTQHRCCTTARAHVCLLRPSLRSLCIVLSAANISKLGQIVQSIQRDGSNHTIQPDHGCHPCHRCHRRQFRRAAACLPFPRVAAGCFRPLTLLASMASMVSITAIIAQHDGWDSEVGTVEVEPEAHHQECRSADTEGTQA